MLYDPHMGEEIVPRRTRRKAPAGFPFGRADDRGEGSGGRSRSQAGVDPNDLSIDLSVASILDIIQDIANVETAIGTFMAAPRKDRQAFSAYVLLKTRP